VQQVAYNYQPIIEDKGFVFHNAVDKTARVNADQESLKIILRNLLDNAIKFSKPEGAIKVYTTTDQNFCNLIVEDTGVGMGEATITTLLSESPALAKKEHEAITGTGLGIQLCKSYVKKNKGVFSIESTLGKGTKMIVSLPKTT
jgi:signal transduction histidine kinase